MEWIVYGFVYLAAAFAGAALPFVRSPGVVLAVLIAVLAATPFGYIAAPPLLPVSFLEVFLLTGLVAALAQFGIKSMVQRVPLVLVLLAGYYLLRVIFDFAVEGSSWFSYVRDARPVVNLCAIVLLGEALRRDSLCVRPGAIIRIAALAIAVDVAIYLGGARLGMVPAGIAGEFLSRTGVLRYSDELTVVLFGFLSYAFFLNGAVSARARVLGLMTVVAVLSLNRIFILFIMFNGALLAYDVIRRKTGSRFAAVGIISAVLGCMVLVAAAAIGRWLGGDSEALARWLDLTSVSRLLTSLAARFVAPAIDGGYELDAYTALFGAGPSFLFYIPWFEYRGLEAYHSSVDSFFFAAFVKYGVVGVALVTMLVARCLWRLPSRWGHAWFWAYLMVHNVIAVPAVLLFLFLSLVTKPRYLIVGRLSHGQLEAHWSRVIRTAAPVGPTLPPAGLASGSVRSDRWR